MKKPLRPYDLRREAGAIRQNLHQYLQSGSRKFTQACLLGLLLAQRLNEAADLMERYDWELLSETSADEPKSDGDG